MYMCHQIPATGRSDSLAAVTAARIAEIGLACARAGGFLYRSLESNIYGRDG